MFQFMSTKQQGEIYQDKTR